MATQTNVADTPADSKVLFQNDHGVKVEAGLVRVSLFEAVFEVYTPEAVLRLSEVLPEFQIHIGGQLAYSGRATVTGLISTGTGIVCEVKIDQAWRPWTGEALPSASFDWNRGFGTFLGEWQRLYRIGPEYKAVLADMHTFLTDLRRWLDEMELKIRAAPTGTQAQREREAAEALGDRVSAAVSELFERFESLLMNVEEKQPEQRAAHSAFAKRLLHPILLCSPFLFRTFRKPLGYAGDYEMVNMICRDPLEGPSLFAKLLNLWFLRQPPAEAHRNRVRWLEECLISETARVAARRRPLRVLNLGCGPAQEIQRFFARKELADLTQFTLIDFNQETADYVSGTLDRLKQTHGCRTPVEILKKSVSQLLKEAARAETHQWAGAYDLVYCAGLFDYLSDPTCRLLSTVLFGWVADGGLYIATNVDSSNPRRLTMEHIMDWHLIYRSGAELETVRPRQAAPNQGRVFADTTGVNLIYSLRNTNLG